MSGMPRSAANLHNITVQFKLKKENAKMAQKLLSG